MDNKSSEITSTASHANEKNSRVTNKDAVNRIAPLKEEIRLFQKKIKGLFIFSGVYEQIFEGSENKAIYIMAVGSRKSIIDDYYDVIDSQLRKSILECFRD